MSMRLKLGGIKNQVKHEFNKFYYFNENKITVNLTKDKRPIYHVHIRKTGGTTINFAFLSNADSDTESFYQSIAGKQNHRQIKDDKVYVGWNIELINEGNYSYAFSHTPLHQLNLPSNAFVFTCMRDPAKRVISHYNNLRYYQVNNINHPCMKVEGKWLGSSFSDFLRALPKEHLMNQLYMFSKDFNISEAYERLDKLDQIIFTETLDDGLKELELKTEWDLPIFNKKSFGFKENINQNELDQLREKLSLEYELFDKIGARI